MWVTVLQDTRARTKISHLGSCLAAFDGPLEQAQYGQLVHLRCGVTCFNSLCVDPLMGPPSNSSMWLQLLLKLLTPTPI